MVPFYLTSKWNLQILGMHYTNDFFFTFSHFDATSIQLLVGSRLFGYGCMNIIDQAIVPH